MNAPAQAPAVDVAPALADLDVLRSYSASRVSRATDADRIANAQDWLKYAADLAADIRGGLAPAVAADRLDRYLSRVNAALNEIGK